jgi:hypothetical protein
MPVAILDKNGFLIGKREGNPNKEEIDPGDLPSDGRYFWKEGKFIPVGFGNGKPSHPNVGKDEALYLALTALLDNRSIPQECRDWCNWYERHGK